jgi:hypothetical protein
MKRGVAVALYFAIVAFWLVSVWITQGRDVVWLVGLGVVTGGFVGGKLARWQDRKEYAALLEACTNTLTNHTHSIAELIQQATFALNDLKEARIFLARLGQRTHWIEARMFGLSAALRPLEGKPSPEDS